MSANSGGTAKIGTDWRVRARQPVGYDVRVLNGLLSPSNSALAAGPPVNVTRSVGPSFVIVLARPDHARAS